MTYNNVTARLLVLVLPAVLVAVADQPHSDAEVYKYVDSDGAIVFTNDASARRRGAVRTSGGAVTYAVEKKPAAPPPSPSERRKIVVKLTKMAEKLGIDPLLAKAVAKIESDFNPTAKSHKGALGIMQLIPGTAERYGVEDPFDVDENIGGGLRYFRDLIDEFEDKRLALAAYNAGENAVRRYGGIPPYRETQHYVRKVFKAYRFYQKLEGVGPLQLFRNNKGAIVMSNIYSPRPVSAQ